MPAAWIAAVIFISAAPAAAASCPGADKAAASLLREARAPRAADFGAAEARVKSLIAQSVLCTAKTGVCEKIVADYLNIGASHPSKMPPLLPVAAFRCMDAAYYLAAAGRADDKACSLSLGEDDLAPGRHARACELREELFSGKSDAYCRSYAKEIKEDGASCREIHALHKGPSRCRAPLERARRNELNLGISPADAEEGYTEDLEVCLTAGQAWQARKEPAACLDNAFCRAAAGLCRGLGDAPDPRCIPSSGTEKKNDALAPPAVETPSPSTAPSQGLRELTLTVVRRGQTILWEPSEIELAPGESLRLILRNPLDATHSFVSDILGVREAVAPRGSLSLTVKAEEAGEGNFYCVLHRLHRGGPVRITPKTSSKSKR